MRLKEHEYDIVDEAINDGGVGIFITKEALERWRDHYWEVAMKEKDEDGGTTRKGWFFLGKLDAIVDILKHFEEEELCILAEHVSTCDTPEPRKRLEKAACISKLQQR